MNNKKLSIVGCGHLGTLLIRRLNHSPLLSKVYTTYQSTKKESLLPYSDGHYQYNLIEGKIPPASFFDSDWIFLLLSPRGNEQSYLQTIQDTLTRLNSDQNVLLVSSTSIYPDIAALFDENSETRVNTVFKAEQLVTNSTSRSITLRLAGLFDDQRHPAHTLSKKSLVKNGQSPVNLIHTHDVVVFLEKILSNSIAKAPKVINLVAPYHPTKKDFYTKECLRLGLQVPLFDQQKKQRIISSTKINQDISFEFKYSNPYLFSL